MSHDDSRIVAGSGTFVSSDAADATTTRALPLASACNTRARADATFRCGWKPRYGSTCVDGNGSTCRSTTVGRRAFEDRQEEGDVADGGFDVGVGWDDEQDGAAGSRFAAAATASARTGEVAPLMRWRGDCSPVSRRTPVSSDRNASDGALAMTTSARQASRAFYYRIADGRMTELVTVWRLPIVNRRIDSSIDNGESSTVANSLSQSFVNDRILSRIFVVE